MRQTAVAPGSLAATGGRLKITTGPRSERLAIFQGIKQPGPEWPFAKCGAGTVFFRARYFPQRLYGCSRMNLRIAIAVASSSLCTFTISEM